MAARLLLCVSSYRYENRSKGRKTKLFNCTASIHFINAFMDSLLSFYQCENQAKFSTLCL